MHVPLIVGRALLCRAHDIFLRVAIVQLDFSVSFGNRHDVGPQIHDNRRPGEMRRKERSM